MEGKTIICAVHKTEDQRNEETWTWLREGNLKTEALLFATKDQAVQTRSLLTNLRLTQNAECVRRKMKPLPTLSVHAWNWHKRNIRESVIMWPRQSTWICGEKVSLNRLIYVGTRSWKVYWKLAIIFITNFFATSEIGQTKKFRPQDQIWWSPIRGKKVAKR